MHISFPWFVDADSFLLQWWYFLTANREVKDKAQASTISWTLKSLVQCLEKHHSSRMDVCGCLAGNEVWQRLAKVRPERVSYSIQRNDQFLPKRKVELLRNLRRKTFKCILKCYCLRHLGMDWRRTEPEAGAWHWLREMGNLKFSVVMKLERKSPRGQVTDPHRAWVLRERGRSETVGDISRFLGFRIHKETWLNEGFEFSFWESSFVLKQYPTQAKCMCQGLFKNKRQREKWL